MIRKISAYLLILFGCFLLVLNMVGIVFAPSLAETASDFSRLEMNRATANWAAQSVKRLEGKKSIDLVRSVMVLVNQRMVNFRESDDYGYVPITENWFLWLLGKLDVEYRKYIFVDHDAALRRGTGQCYQQSLVVVSILQGLGVRAGVVGLNHHVIARADFEDESYLIDPDYGVLLEFNLDYARNNLDEVETKYEDMLSQFISPEIKKITIGKIINAYQKAPEIQAGDGVEGSIILKEITFEKQAYITKWVTPLGLIVLGLFVLFWIRRNEK